jgi:hypothetical protein
MFVLMPCVAAGQTPGAADTSRKGPDRLSLQFAGGTVPFDANVLSASVGFSPTSRLDLLVTVERLHLPFELTRFSDGYSRRRGGTMSYVTGEVRYSLLPPERLSPFVFGGIGGGSWRATVNADFPDLVRHEVRLLHIGGGVRVPLRLGLSLLGDARLMVGTLGLDGVIAWPIRAGVIWRF